MSSRRPRDLSIPAEAQVASGREQALSIPRLVEAAARDDIGTGRSHNEDRAGVFPEIGLGVVADGMGGQHSGDVAAEITISTLEKCLRRPNDRRVCGPSWDWDLHWLVQAIRVASVRIAARSYSQGETPTPYGSGLGATVAAADDGYDDGYGGCYECPTPPPTTYPESPPPTTSPESPPPSTPPPPSTTPDPHYGVSYPVPSVPPGTPNQPPSPASPPTLARTGSDTGVLVGIGAGAVVLGGGLVVLARRRRLAAVPA